MYVINPETRIVNKWADNPANRQRLASGKYGVIEFAGNVETVNGIMYEKGFAPIVSLEEAKVAKLADLNVAFAAASENACCLSSAGFRINADETANRNVSSLIIALEAAGAGIVQFCAYDNNFHDVTLEQLKAMQLEIIANARAIYERKWTLREQISSCDTVESLDAVVIDFIQGEE